MTKKDILTIELNAIMEDCDTPNKDDHCVYCLIDSDDTVIYVGQTKNLKSRIYQHLCMGKEFCRVTFEVCKKEEALNKEAEAIINNKPKLNRVLPTNSIVETTTQTKEKVNVMTAELMKDISAVYENGSAKYIDVSTANEINKIISKSIAECRARFIDKE